MTTGAASTSSLQSNLIVPDLAAPFTTVPNCGAEWQFAARTLLIAPSEGVSDELWPVRIAISNRNRDAPIYSGYQEFEVDFLMHCSFFESSGDERTIMIKQNAFIDNDRLREWEELFHRFLRTANGIPMPDLGYPGNPNPFYIWLARETIGLEVKVTFRDPTLPGLKVTPFDGQYVWHRNREGVSLVTFTSSPRSQSIPDTATPSLQTMNSTHTLAPPRSSVAGSQTVSISSDCGPLTLDKSLNFGWEITQEAELDTQEGVLKVTFKIKQYSVEDSAVSITGSIPSDSVMLQVYELHQKKRLIYGKTLHGNEGVNLSQLENELDSALKYIPRKLPEGGKQRPKKVTVQDEQTLKEYLLKRIISLADQPCDYVEL
jgi:hypothetical protein